MMSTTMPIKVNLSLGLIPLLISFFLTLCVVRIPASDYSLLVEDVRANRWFIVDIDGNCREIKLGVTKGDYLQVIPNGQFLTYKLDDGRNTPRSVRACRLPSKVGDEVETSMEFQLPAVMSMHAYRALLSPDGSKIVCYGPPAMKILNIAAGKWDENALVSSSEAMAIRNPSWNRESSLVAFYLKERDDSFSLWVADAEGKSARCISPKSVPSYKLGLGDDMESNEISWTPDGKNVIFGARFDNAHTGNVHSSVFVKCHIYSINIDSLKCEMVVEGAYPILNPNGSMLVFSDGEGQKIINLNTREIKILDRHNTGGMPIFNPTGDMMVFDTYETRKGLGNRTRISVLSGNGSPIFYLDPPFSSWDHSLTEQIGRKFWIANRQ